MVVGHALTNEEDEVKEIINIYTCMTVIFFFHTQKMETIFEIFPKSSSLCIYSQIWFNTGESLFKLLFKQVFEI